MPFLLMRTASVLAAGFLLAGASHAAAASAAGGGTIAGTSATSGYCPAYWTADHLPVPPLPSPARPGTQVLSVAVLRTADVWVLLGRGGNDYVYHLNGGKWKESAYLNASDINFTGQSIVAGSDTDVWVAGENDSSGEDWHYNGSTWTELAAPVQPNTAQAAALDSSGILYVAGTNTHGFTGVWSYNGAQWTDLAQPVPRSEGDNAIALTQGGTLVVGTDGYSSRPAPVLQERTGTGWTTISVPSVTFVSGITVVPGGTVYAVGGESGNQAVLIKQAPGSPSATVVGVPATDSATAHQLTGVIVTGPDDLWLLGNYQLPGGGSRPWITHFDGTNFLAASTPDFSSYPSDNAIRGGVSLGTAVLAYGSTEVDLGFGEIPAPVLIAVCPVQVTRDAIVPSHQRTPIGSQMFWSVQATAGSGHELVAPEVFDSGPVGPGGSFATGLFAAATYAVRDTVTGTSQTIRVPAGVSPASGAPSTVFTVTCASLQAPAGYAYRVLLKRPGSSRYTLLTTTSLPTATFLPYHGTGTYQFECRVQTPEGVTGASPPTTISVS